MFFCAYRSCINDGQDKALPILRYSQLVIQIERRLEGPDDMQGEFTKLLDTWVDLHRQRGNSYKSRGALSFSAILSVPAIASAGLVTSFLVAYVIYQIPYLRRTI